MTGDKGQLLSDGAARRSLSEQWETIRSQQGTTNYLEPNTLAKALNNFTRLYIVMQTKSCLVELKPL